MDRYCCSESILNAFFLYVGIFSFVVTSFFCSAFTMLVVHFFCLFHFCILLHVFMCVLQNYLLICLLASLIFMVVCMITLLPHFLHCFQAVFHYLLLSNYSHLYFLIFCRLLPVPLPRFSGILQPQLSFCCVADFFYTLNFSLFFCLRYCIFVSCRFFLIFA